MLNDASLILLVEEEPVLAQVTGFRLELLGFEVETVTSADEAFEAVERRMPNTIMLDLGTSENDGIALTERFSNDPRTAKIPIMVLSHNADLDEVERAHEAGASDYLVVPYDPSVLEEKLEKLFQ